MVALMVTLRKDCDEVTGQMFQLLSSNIMSQKLILFLMCFGYHFFFLLAISFHWGHIKSLRDICFRLCLSDWWVSSSTRLSHGGYHLFISSQIHPGSYKQIKYLFCFILLFCALQNDLWNHSCNKAAFISEIQFECGKFTFAAGINFFLYTYMLRKQRAALIVGVMDESGGSRF